MRGNQKPIDRYHCGPGRDAEHEIGLGLQAGDNQIYGSGGRILCIWKAPNIDHGFYSAAAATLATARVGRGVRRMKGNSSKGGKTM